MMMMMMMMMMLFSHSNARLPEMSPVEPQEKEPPNPSLYEVQNNLLKNKGFQCRSVKKASRRRKDVTQIGNIHRSLTYSKNNALLCRNERPVYHAACKYQIFSRVRWSQGNPSRPPRFESLLTRLDPSREISNTRCPDPTRPARF